MVSLFNYNEILISQFVDEFRDAANLPAEMAYACVYRSSDFPDSRQVFGITAEDGKNYALKIDTDAGNGRLQREFGVLEELFPYFQTHEQTKVVEPIYLSPSGQFHVTDFVDHKTAKLMICTANTDTQAGQVYRRAGQWLHDLHSYRPARKDRFWFNWMFEEIEEVLCKTQPHAAASDYRPYLQQMQRESARFEHSEDIVVFAHGDFHGDNIIMGRGVTYGLDFADAFEKLAVYDIVDFLKVDIYRNGPADEVDRSGILFSSKDMFLRKYRHPINRDILDFCIRGRLLIDWLSISEDFYVRSDTRRTRFSLLAERLSLAFQFQIETA